MTSNTDNVETTSGLTLQERVDAATDALSRGDFSTMLRLLTLTSLGNEVEDRPARGGGEGMEDVRHHRTIGK